MIGDNERSEIEKTMRASPEHARTAKAVYDAWPNIRDRVCQEFLERLKSRIDPPPSVRIKIEDQTISMSKEAWPSVQPSSGKTAGRIAVCMAPTGGRYSGWCFGVRWPVARGALGPGGQKQMDRIVETIESELPGSKTLDSERPVCRYLRGDGYKRFNDWGDLLPELMAECGSPGEISRYFIEEFAKVSSVALRAIDFVYGVER